MIKFADIRKLVLVGDIHGKFPSFHAFARRTLGREVAVVQVGDFGHGFLDHATAAGAGDFFRENVGTCGFIRGNHDDPEVCRMMPGWIPDGHHDPVWNIMFVGGAHSVDRHLRIQGLDWWEDEECSIAELNKIVDRYDAVKPRIMVTHDAPSAAIEAVFPHVRLFRPLSRTTQAFDAMIEAHRPDAWIFGHWHRSASAVLDGTRFQCLGELRSCTLSLCRPGGTVRLSGGSERV
ncbi:MAG: metallophosphoesterase [Boseongicola sp.]|nr:metallophosphoesterase [Boseongicola sp.]